MRPKQQQYPFQPGFGRKRADGSSRWLNNSISIGVERLNTIIGSISYIKTSGSTIIIALDKSWPEALADIKDIITQRISFTSTPIWTKGKKGKTLTIAFKSGSGISETAWYINNLLGSKYSKMLSKYSAKNGNGCVITFRGAQDMSYGIVNTVINPSADDTKDDKTTTSSGSSDATETDETTGAGGVNWLLIGGIVAALVIAFLIFKK